MKTAIITVGKEVLTGKTINTNLATISRRLNEIGIDVNRSIVIDDIKEEYYKILDFCESELIIFKFFNSICSDFLASISSSSMAVIEL